MCQDAEDGGGRFCFTSHRPIFFLNVKKRNVRARAVQEFLAVDRDLTPCFTLYVYYIYVCMCIYINA